MVSFSAIINESNKEVISKEINQQNDQDFHETIFRCKSQLSRKTKQPLMIKGQNVKAEDTELKTRNMSRPLSCAADAFDSAGEWDDVEMRTPSKLLAVLRPSFQPSRPYRFENWFIYPCWV